MALDPNKWQPIDAEPITPGATLMTPPPPRPSINPYLRTTIPDAFQLQPDLVKQQYTPAIPQIRVMPLPPSARPGVNATAQGVAKIIATTVAQTIVNNNSGGSSGTDSDIITDKNRQLFGSLDTVTTSTSTDATGNINAISTTGLTSGINELAVAIAIGKTNAGTAGGLTPGAGWVSIGANGAWQKVIAAAGSLTVVQALGSASYAAAQALAIFKSNGSAPAFTGHGSGSGGTTLTSATWTATAGNSIMFLATTADGDTAPFIPSATDTQGNTYVLTVNPLASINLGGANIKSAQCVILYAQNIAGGSTTVTIKSNGAQVFADWNIYEVTNLGNIGSGSYTFASSDANKLVQFSGGANVVATLPSPALAAGWQVQVSNNSPGTTSITPAVGVLLNNGTAPVTLPSGGSTWIWSDGTNYWTTTITLPLKLTKVASKWLDSFDPFTGLFTQSQPAFTDISGTASNAQLPSAISVTTVGASQGFATGSNFATNGSGVITSYNGRATVGNGITAIQATVDTTTNGANIASTTLYTIPGSGQYSSTYRVVFYLSVTRAATTSSTLPDIQFTATDTDTSTVITYGPFAAPVPTGNSLSTVYSGEVIVRAKLNTNITYQVGNATQFASSGGTSMQYSLHLRLEAM